MIESILASAANSPVNTAHTNQSSGRFSVRSDVDENTAGHAGNTVSLPSGFRKSQQRSSLFQSETFEWD